MEPTLLRAAVRRKVLFLNQGQATKRSAVGHIRFEQTIQALLPRLGNPVDARFVRMARFNPVEMALAAPMPAVPGRAWFDLRWFLIRSRGARRLIRRELRRDRPDVVHVTTNDVALMLGDLQHEVPCVIASDVLLEDWTRLLTGVAEGGETPAPLRPLVRAEHQALRAAPLVVPWTETVAAAVRRAAPDARTAVLHPGIDVELFRPPPPGSRGGGPRRVLFVGGRFRAKGGPALVDAVARLGGDVELHVVTTEAVAPQPGVVLHKAQAGSAELIQLFQSADVFCLPTEADAVPWVVLEAMGCGVPVVSTAVGSIPEMVPPGCGRVVQPRDPDALVAALGEVLNSPQRRRDMAEEARAHVERAFDASVNTTKLLDLLVDVADRHGR